jgi:ATP-binding cassette subfamily C protein CydCD
MSSSASASFEAQPAGEAGPGKADPVRDLSADAEAVGWIDTLRSLGRFVRPWRGQLAATTLSGIARVVAFIAVGVLGALAIAAVKSGSDAAPWLWALLIVAPLAGILHWLESWLAHVMAYRLLAQMRIDLYA